MRLGIAVVLALGAALAGWFVGEGFRVGRQDERYVSVKGIAEREAYLFTKLNDVKPAMIAEATKRAREGAEQFAADSGSHVGGIRRASQGLFQILARDDTPGTSEQRQINKTVRVVTTIDYLLVD